MTYTAGEWLQEYDDGHREPMRIVAVNHTTSTVTTRSATVEVALPYPVTFGGTEPIDIPWSHKDPRPDGNRAQRRAWRFGHVKARR